MPTYIQDPRAGRGETHAARQDSYHSAQHYQQPYQNYPQTQPQMQQQPQQNMGDQFSSQHKLGATFYPGAQDDYYMPVEVVSPLPQRIMPELEQNVEGGLARLELKAQNGSHTRTQSIQSVMSPQTTTFYDELGLPTAPVNSQPRPAPPSLTPSYNRVPQGYEGMREEYIQKQIARNMPDSPMFSPFPKPRNPGPNIPLSDEDEEELLERMRTAVLSSADPELQLGWAQDALTWVETASSHALRQQDGGQPARSITPKVERQLRNDAKSIVEFLGEQHHPKAEFMIGMWLEFGKLGHRIDKKEAFLSYRRAAEKQYSRAEYRIGMQYEGSNNPVKAIEHYKKGVALKDSASNYRYGMMTLLGQHGVTLDHRKGVELIRYAARGADKNAPQGAYVYGMLLSRELPNIDIPDEYLPFDLNEAKTFIEKAAKYGFAKAQLKMAQAYELCQLGCEFDPVLSLHYNALASRQGEAEADMAISKWFLCGYEKLFAKNEELAFTYAKRAASTKMATAEFALGYFYEIGIHVPRDLRQSEIWYNLALEHGNKDALNRIESIKKNSTLTKQDHEKVALNRIKSQYGSMHGKKPDRFKEKPPPMPSMSEDAEMPDPTKSYSQTGQARPPGRQPTLPQVSLPPLQNRPPVNPSTLPPRPVSAAPYPEDDGPPKFTQPPSKMNAPYPTVDNNRLNPRPGPQADRPSSAFGIRPLVNIDTYGPVVRGDQRPATSMANLQPSGGRGQTSAGRGGWESNVPSQYTSQPNRPMSQPPIQPVNQPLSQPPNRLDSLPSQQNRLNSLPSQLGRQPTLPRIDLDQPVTNAGRGRTPQTPINVNKPHPSPPMQSPNHYSNGHQQRPASPGGPAPAPKTSSSQYAHGYGADSSHIRTSSGGQVVRPERGSSMAPVNSSNNARPDRYESAQAPVPAAGSGRRPLPNNTMSSQPNDVKKPNPTPSPAPSSSLSNSSTSTASKTSGPKKGPSTFDEMGIPAGKSDNDCVVM